MLWKSEWRLWHLEALSNTMWQVFLLLVAEMILFMLLIVPLPFTWRLKVRINSSVFALLQPS
jgi:hypothetical protein